jgi:hypothetical protein
MPSWPPSTFCLPASDSLFDFVAPAPNIGRCYARTLRSTIPLRRIIEAITAFESNHKLDLIY